MKNKRGISPLIATVLIIGFCIALAAIVMTWGGGFVRTTTEKTEASADMALKCSTELDFEIKSVDKTSTPNKITIDNRGSIAIKKLILRFYEGDSMIPDSEVPYDLEIAAYAVTNIDVGTIDAGADKVDALATIDDGTTDGHTCGQSPREKSF